MKVVLKGTNKAIKNLEEKVDDLEMYGRRILGIPERKDENTDELVMKVVNQLGADVPPF